MESRWKNRLRVCTLVIKGTEFSRFPIHGLFISGRDIGFRVVLISFIGWDPVIETGRKGRLWGHFRDRIYKRNKDERRRIDCPRKKNTYVTGEETLDSHFILRRKVWSKNRGDTGVTEMV